MEPCNAADEVSVSRDARLTLDGVGGYEGDRSVFRGGGEHRLLMGECWLGRELERGDSLFVNLPHRKVGRERVS